MALDSSPLENAATRRTAALLAMARRCERGRMARATAECFEASKIVKGLRGISAWHSTCGAVHAAHARAASNFRRARAGEPIQGILTISIVCLRLR